MSKKVLVIDDDPDFVEAVTTLLEAKNYSVISAENGEKGFESAKIDTPDIIILDVMMTTKTEGFNAARNLHEEPLTKDIPVIMVTGIRKDMNLPFGFEANDDWLPVKTLIEKPVKPDVLLKVVEENIR